MLSAVVCDDQRLFGESFALALRAVGLSASLTSQPHEALARLEAAPADRAVMNVLFPGGEGLAATRYIRTTWPQIHISCVVADNADGAQAALDAGAHAILVKKRPLAELVQIVLSGSGTPSGEHRRAGLRPAPRAAEYPLNAQFLTNRERDVLELLVSARSTERIADQLGISVTTARGYVQSLLAKLGVHSRVEAVAYAIRHSVVDPRGSGAVA